MSRDATRAEPAHVPALDGIRGTAIFIVMLIHLWCAPQTTWIDRVFCIVTNLGVFGPDLFFVLSGYLITGILLDAKGASHYYRNFYLRRILRVFPLYYLVLALSLFVLPHLLPPDKAARFGSIAGDEPYYWLYFSNFAIARAGTVRHGVLDVTWTLAIEEQFYFVWPALVGLCSRRTLARVAIGLSITALLVRVGLFFFSHYNNFSIYVLTPSRLDALAVGSLFAVWAREPGGLAKIRPQVRRVVLAVLPFVIGIPVAEELLEPPNGFGIGMGPVCLCVGYSLVAVFFGGLLALVVTSARGSALDRIFGSTFLRTFGKYSYGLYLIHLPLRALIRDKLFGPSYLQSRFHFPQIHGSELPGQLLFYVVAEAAAFCGAWLSFHLFEKQFLKLKRFFPSGVTAS